MTIIDKYNQIISNNGIIKAISISNKYIINKYINNYHLKKNNTSFLNPGSFYMFDYNNKKNIILSAGNNKRDIDIIENAIVISNIDIMKRMTILSGFFTYFRSKYEKNISMELLENNSIEHIIFDLKDFYEITGSNSTQKLYRKYNQEHIKNLKKIDLIDVHYLLLVNFS